MTSVAVQAKVATKLLPNLAMKKILKQAAKAVCPPLIWDAAKLLTAQLRARRDIENDERIAVMKATYDRLNRDLPPGEMALRPGLKLRVHPQSVEAFEYFCYRAPAMFQELDAFVAASANARNLLDIGALHGMFSLVFAAGDASRRAVAIDPSPLAFAKLLYNIHANEAANIESVECAITETEGTLPMRFVGEHAVASGASRHSYSVQAVARTGDAVCDSRGFSPDIIKVDVEGHEVKVLRGLPRTLERCRPIVFLELHPRWIRDEGDSLGEISDVFHRLGYRAATVDGQEIGLTGIDRLVDDERVMFTPLTE